jgi:ABC-type polysaccharide/polyol phosphate transport system ATPase subunit
MKSNAVIQVSHLTKTFKKRLDKPITLKERLISRKSKATITKTVLDDISFEINKGQTTGIIGVNGSGKSTILKMLSKIYYPTSGNVKTKDRLDSLIELVAGFHPDFTGRENIYFNASIFGLNKKQIDKRIDEIIEFSELGYEIDKTIRKY